MEQHPPSVDQERLARVRQARQVIAGGDLLSPVQPGGRRGGARDLLESAEIRYFLVLAVLVLLSAIVWAIWGTGFATPFLLILALALLLAWFIL